MKQILYTLSLILGIAGCNGQTIEKKATMGSNDSLALAQKYDKIFISGLPDLFNKPYKLMDNYVIVEKDTIYYPEDLPINKEIIFQGYKNHEMVLLSITRTTLTNILYSYRHIGKDNKVLNLREGIAILYPTLVTEEEQNDGKRIKNISLFWPAYLDNSDNCWFEFKFSHNDELKKLDVDIHLSCKDKKSGEIVMDDYCQMTELP